MAVIRSLALAALAACAEPALLLRALEIELIGLAVTAAVVEFRIFEPGEVPPCRSLEPSDALALPAVESARWVRGEARRIELTGAELSEMQVVVVALDESAQPIQIGCDVYAHTGLQSPEQVITLSMR